MIRRNYPKKEQILHMIKAIWQRKAEEKKMVWSGWGRVLYSPRERILLPAAAYLV